MTLTHALRYGELGIRVFPVVPKEKRPLYSGWQRDATTDPDMIRRYWPETLDRNIAAVCGETFDAWDIEVEHIDRFSEWLNTNGYVLPETPLASTGRGGMHILTQPTGVDGTRYLYLDGVHIGELKSTGGFILVTPSVTTGDYRWVWAPKDLEMAPAPSWLLSLLERPKGTVHKFTSRVTSVEDGMRALEALVSAVKGAGTGSRNNYLYWAMRRALEQGVPPNLAGQALLRAGVDAGLETHEARATLRSAYDAEGAVQ